MTLVDTNVLLDVLLVGAEHGDESERRLAAALRAGPVVVNDVIAAELAPVFDTETDLMVDPEGRRDRAGSLSTRGGVSRRRSTQTMPAAGRAP
jgi:predicted nucleic acid-binding protein